MVRGTGPKELRCGDWAVGCHLEWNHKDQTIHQSPFSQQENHCSPAVLEVGSGIEGEDQRLGQVHRAHLDKAP